MKKTLFIMFVTLIVSNIKAQDLIVTKKGDSINCSVKVDKTKKVLYLGTLWGKHIRWSPIKTKNVKTFSKGFYNLCPAISKGTLERKNNFSRWYFSAELGYGHRLGKLWKGLNFLEKEHMNRLRKGFILKAKGTYYFDQNYGFGLTVINHHASSNLKEINTKIDILNIIPHFSSKVYLNRGKGLLHYSIGLGLGVFNLKNSANQNNLTVSESLNKSNIVYYSEIGYKMSIDKHWSWGPTISLSSGKISVNDNSENISHLDFTIGICFIP